MATSGEKSIACSTSTAMSSNSAPRLQVILCFLGLILMNLMAAIDSTALSVALPVRVLTAL
jgi:hypothetical protein